MSANTIPRLVIAVPLSLALGAFGALLWAAEANKPAPVTLPAESPYICEAIAMPTGNLAIVVGARP